MRIVFNIRDYLNSLRYRPEQFFYFFFIIFIAANGVIIPIGRDWTLPQIMAIAMIFLGIIKFSIGLDRRKLKILAYPFGIILIWLVTIAISMLLAPPKPYSPYTTEPLQSYGVIGLMFYFWIVLDVLLMWVVFLLAKKGDILIKTFRFLIFSSVIYSIYGIYQYVMASFFGASSNPIVYALNYQYLYYDYIVRLLSLSREPLYFVNYICPVIIICLSLLTTKSHNVLGLSRSALCTITGVNLLAFFLAKSIGGFIAMLGSLFVILIVYCRTYFKNISSKRLVYGISGIVVFALGFYQLFGREVKRKLISLFDPTSGYGRIVSLIEGVESVLQNPLFGFGLGHSKFFISVTQIHNAYLNIAAETGIISLLCFIAFILYLAFRLFRAYRIAGRYQGLVLGIAAAYIYILIQWLSFFAYIVLFAWFLFGLILALPQALESLHQRKYVLYKYDQK